MIEKILSEICVWIWANTFGLVDPFWGYLFDGLLIIAACVALGWFFSILRPIGGAVVMTVIAFLVGFWKGERKRK